MEKGGYIQNWLTSKEIQYDEDMVRAELLSLIMMITDELAKSQNKTVLGLPPYKLNPIEVVWAQIKNEMALEMYTTDLDDVRGRGA
ncbi:t-box protein-related [Holotrichia oblita]|uniref:T-box protein-related n=1 Tax=Holotrichia oblita TaxID=644536 RepID=A0ACB9SLL4_HOLOL|nr:t-box protein-related [Holotrichia oblita]